MLLAIAFVAGVGFGFILAAACLGVWLLVTI
jgi:hypothetical protein